MLKFNNWTIEQTDWLPNEEKEIVIRLVRCFEDNKS